MNGPEHYREATDLLLSAEDADPEEAARLVARAAVHAQLAAVAVAALSADRNFGPGLPDEDYEAWDATAGVQVADDPDELVVAGGLD